VEGCRTGVLRSNVAAIFLVVYEGGGIGVKYPSSVSNRRMQVNESRAQTPLMQSSTEEIFSSITVLRGIRNSI